MAKTQKMVIIDREITYENPKTGVRRTFPAGWKGPVSVAELKVILAATAGREIAALASAEKSEADDMIVFATTRGTEIVSQANKDRDEILNRAQDEAESINKGAQETAGEIVSEAEEAASQITARARDEADGIVAKAKEVAAKNEEPPENTGSAK